MGYLSSIAKRSIYDGGTFGAAKWDTERGIIKRSLSLSFAFNTNSLSLSAVSPPRLASDEIYGYGNLGAVPVGPYTANNFPAPIAEDLRTRRRKKGSRSLIGQGDVSISVGNLGGASDDLCVMLSMSHSRPAPCLSLMRDDTRQRAHALCYAKSVAYGNEATGRRSGVEGRREAASAKKQCRIRPARK